MIRLVIPAVLAAAIEVGASAQDQGVSLMLVDGSVERGGPVALGPEFGVRFPDGRQFPLDRVVELRLPGQPAAPTEVPPAAVHLHDGSFLVGRTVGGDDLELFFELPGGPRVPINVDALQALFLGESAVERELSLYQRGGDQDVLHRRRGGARADFTTGTLLTFGEKQLEFEYSLGEGKFPLDEVEALILAQQIDLPEREGVQIEVDLWPDGRLRGEWTSIDANHLHLRPLFAEEPVPVPRTSLRGLRPLGGRPLWLSDVEPRAVQETPFVGGDDLFLFPHRRDRSVTGAPLQVAGKRYAKGLGCHARTRLDYDLEALGPVQRFRAEVGISDEVLQLADRGAVQFAVLVDGEEVLRTETLRAGDPARPISVDLTGRSTLSLIADFAEGGDVADRAVWGAALLLR